MTEENRYQFSIRHIKSRKILKILKKEEVLSICTTYQSTSKPTLNRSKRIYGGTFENQFILSCLNRTKLCLERYCFKDSLETRRIKLKTLSHSPYSQNKHCSIFLSNGIRGFSKVQSNNCHYASTTS